MIASVQESHFDSKFMRIMFDTGAALHVCPWWYGEQFPTFNASENITIVGASGKPIQVYGLRTIYFRIKLLKGDFLEVAFTFVVCDVTEPILSFSKLLETGCDCSMKQEQLKLGFGENPVELHHEGLHFYLYPEEFLHGKEPWF